MPTAEEGLLSLPVLQSRIARDPTSYRDEFVLRLRHFEAQVELVKQDPSTAGVQFAELVGFLGAVAPRYPSEASSFPKTIIELLEQHAASLPADTRRRMCVGCISMRNRDMIAPAELLQLLLRLLKVPDKQLRTLLLGRIVADVKAVNKKKRNHKVNSALQNVLHSILGEGGPAARLSLGMMMELYKRKVWDDERTINLIADAALSTDTHLALMALHFFLTDEPGKVGNEQDSSSESEGDAVKALRKSVEKHRKSGKHRTKKMRKALEQAKASKRRQPVAAPGSTALRLLHDPHGFVEKLLARARGAGGIVRWEVKQVILQVVSRCIAVHRLLILRFYPLITGYLQPSREEVTQMLAITAQAVHELVPPDVVENLIRVLADRFVSDHSRPLAVAAGLNTIRAICQRNPHGMSEDLLRDLAQYSKDRDKSVAAAARSLISVYRSVNATMLARRDRGKPTEATKHAALQYGQSQVATGIDGIELLQPDEVGKDEGWTVPIADDSSDSEIELPDGYELPRGWSSSSDSEDLSDIDLDEKEVKAADGAHEADDSEESGDDDSGDSGDEDDDDDSSGDESDADSGNESSDEASEEESNTAGPAKKVRIDPAAKAQAEPQETKPSIPLEAQTILTPADFERLRDLKTKMLVDGQKHKKKRKLEPTSAPIDAPNDEDDVVVRLKDIEGKRKKARADKDERLASVMAGREGREKFGSKRGKEKGGGSNNQVKSKNKVFAMTKHSRAVRAKSRMSKRDKQQRHSKHVKKQKMGPYA